VVAIEGGSGFFESLPALRRTWWGTGLASAVIAAVLAILLLGVFRALERSERNLRATAALATAGQLAAVVAHEIRNPLAGLLSRAERAQEELEAGTDPGRIAELLDAIPLEVRRLDRILTNYLSLARPPEEVGSCPVGPVVEETLELVSKELSRVGVKIALTQDSGDLRARIASGPLRQALLNLFLNAKEAMPGGGELRVRIGGGPSSVTIEVEDTGTGIEPSVRKRIFEPFFTTRPTGSGLGLAVVESVVHSCAGRVDVRSEPGSGAVFLLNLPRDRIGEKNGRTSGAVPDPARRG
jgi:two-component system sensor histidine kinase HydH